MSREPIVIVNAVPVIYGGGDGELAGTGPMIAALLFGTVMGFLSAIPVAGPVSAMVVDRALSRRYAAALAVAVGTAVAEGFYAALAVLGLAAVADEPWVELASRAVAGAVLIAVGLVFALRRGPGPRAGDNVDEPTPRTSKLWGQWMVGFTITVANPTLIATWAAVTSMLMASGWVALTPALAVPFGLAVAAGVAAWFALVVVLVRRFARGLGPAAIGRVLRWVGWALVGLGSWFIARFIGGLAAA